MDKPFRGPALNTAIQEHIKQYITDKHLGPGDALPTETQLALDLGVSRNSVREAVKALQSLGIVEVRHGNGVFVRQFNFDSVLDLLSYGLAFDPSRIAEILQIRKWLETAAIGEVVQRISESELAQLEELLERWDAQARAHEPTAEEDRAFHRMLYVTLGNESLIALLDIFWVVYHSVRIHTITTDLQPTTTIQDHRDILSAVQARDVSLAQQRIQQHFSNLDNRIKSAVTK